MPGLQASKGLKASPALDHVEVQQSVGYSQQDRQIFNKVTI